MLQAMSHLTSLAVDSGVLPSAGEDVTSIVGLLNYGVLGILAIGFIKGWVVSPRERDRLAEDIKNLREEAQKKESEIARLNGVIQENLQAMTVTMDKQLDLAAHRARVERGGVDGDVPA